MSREPPVPGIVKEFEAVRLACDLYGFSPAGLGAFRLPGEYDDNFSLQCADGRRFVFKVMNPSRAVGLVDLQCATLVHLAKTVPDLDMPRVQATVEGKLFTMVARPDGTNRIAWMLSWVEGKVLAETRPHTRSLMFKLGWTLGRIATGLTDFSNSAAARDLKWDLSRPMWARSALDQFADPARRELVARALNRFEKDVQPGLGDFRRSVLHADANDYNVLVRGRGDEVEVSLIDFGDMHLGITIAEAAVGAAYAILGKRDLLATAADVVAGYHTAFPLEDREFELIAPLIGARLAVSVANAARMKIERPDDPYVTISEAPAWDALSRWDRLSPRVAEARFRDACGVSPKGDRRRVVDWIGEQAATMSPILDLDLRSADCLVFDLSVSSLLLGANPAATATATLTETLSSEMRKAGVAVGVGRYDEARLLYLSPLFGEGGAPTDERRTVHLGVDLFVAPGSNIKAPCNGRVHILANNASPQDYGPLVVLRHETPFGSSFFTLFGHLSDDTLSGLHIGQEVEAGQVIGRVGSPPSNGDWSPHLHFQIILDLLDLAHDFPGVCRATEREFWKQLCPDPNLILGIKAEKFGPPRRTPAELEVSRRAHLGRNVRLSYRNPINLVRGFGCYLYDETGRAYLDMYNNVPLVGHSHPRVVAAAAAQLGLLNTNTRYLHENIVHYAGRLKALLPDPLSVVFFVASGSEANELALRLTRAHTHRDGVIVLEHAYHGHTTTLIDVSPYKFNGPGGEGRKDFVTVAPMPDDYRGPYKRDDPGAGLKYARGVGRLVDELVRQGRPPGAFLAETLPSVGGQIVPPPGYLAEVYQRARARGAVCIADEVQVGLGRLGTHFWGFEMQGVTPDIVVLGKPIGNGFPLGAVITTPAIASSFDHGMEFFSTFGGNPVACAAGLAVLDVVRDEGLQQRALEMGERLLSGLQDLMRRRPLIGDLRGSGLFLGVELVKDRTTLEPAKSQAAYVVNRLREMGILTGTDGPHENVLKLRPPLTLQPSDVDLFLSRFDDVLGEGEAQV